MKTLNMIIWAGAIVAVLVVSMLPEIRFSHGADKGVHFAVYALLAVIPVFTLNQRKIAFGSLLLLLMFSGAIEVFQQFSGREASFTDLLANGCGIITGAITGYLLKAGLREV